MDNNSSHFNTRRVMSSWRYRWRVVYLLGCVLIAGCGDDRGLVPVRGRITLDGADMPGKGYLRFVPLEVAQGYVRRAGLAHFDTDGAYRVKSFQPGDGLFPGKYAIFVFCWEVEPNMNGKPAKSFLPDKYVDPEEPPFMLTVEEGQGVIDFDISVEP